MIELLLAFDINCTVLISLVDQRFLAWIRQVRTQQMKSLCLQCTRAETMQQLFEDS